MTIRPAGPGDLEALLRLAEARRIQYQTYQPIFWRPASNATEVQRPHLSRLIEDEDIIAIVAESDRQVVGFAIATLVPAPPVYDPGGLTCLIDDFTMATSEDWASVGEELLHHVGNAAHQRGATQIVIVTAHLDQSKRRALAAAGLSVASEWWVGSLGDHDHAPSINLSEPSMSVSNQPAPG